MSGRADDTDPTDTDTMVPENPDGEDTAGTGEDGHTDDADEDSGNDPAFKGLDPKTQEKLDKRFGKLTAQKKAAQARVAELEAKQRDIDERAQAAQQAQYAHLGVDPEYFSDTDRQTLDKAEADIEKAETAADFWSEHDASEPVEGKTYTEAECRKFARMAAEKAGLAKGRKAAIVERARAEMLKDLKAVREARSGKKTPAPPPKPKKPADGDDGADKDGGAPPTPPARPQDAGSKKVQTPLAKNKAEARAWLDG